MQQTKSQVRARILAARRASTPASRAAEAAALTRHLLAWIPSGATVCAYVPVGTEPGSRGLLDELVLRDVTVLLPVAREDPVEGPRPLQWGRYRPDTLVAAPFGLQEPPPPHLPPEAMTDATVVLVPALAVDVRGARLGRGAGFYDRTLRLADPAAALIAVVRDEELVAQLPADPHDVPMTHAVTPERGVVAVDRPR
ncbi:5-formyltetrahydrofolate cyclo-ligase [Mycolicibacterium psychrotolerans]|uniref:5-formyltetrahydrofolate cyclo-ligase n=1 Tax=Mycolicibacterium psychrotolerans TaxID=216929 RepID=A0A7I7M8J7_9MYCO|nr:5-formyltetrahydrofolate cyclo-ligase [Mycolicibacterium psychrotolerans]BBX68558.1 5-formyltetrahydrofolate cyclo-ligase [Mycolicibacterium psychrotolerans]